MAFEKLSGESVEAQVEIGDIDTGGDLVEKPAARRAPARRRGPENPAGRRGEDLKTSHELPEGEAENPPLPRTEKPLMSIVAESGEIAPESEKSDEDKFEIISAAQNFDALYEGLRIIGGIRNPKGRELIGRSDSDFGRGYTAERLIQLIEAFRGNIFPVGAEGGVIRKSRISQGVSLRYIPEDYGLRAKVAELYRLSEADQDRQESGPKRADFPKSDKKGLVSRFGGLFKRIFGRR